ncbi:MAG: iron-containing alcohol dehydrogenase [Bacillota bacterium]|jgi:alcohol dehydrogenase YqhD (iron-dependent ADH family)
MLNFIYHNPGKIIFGRDGVAQLGNIIAPYGRTILLVTGGGSIKKNGLYDRVARQLTKAGLKFFEVDGIQPNPRLSSVNQGITLCKEHQIEFILAVGGGSVIDAAKTMAAGAKYDGDVWDFFEQRAECKQALPLGTILTLAATGSEMNGGAVITKWETNQKLAISTPLLVPRFSILDPTLTFSVPRRQTVNGIVDIMAHVFEQYFSPTPDTALQDRLAESILQTMIETAPMVLAQPENYEARASMLWCGTLALNSLLARGKITDWASHAIEHEVSAIYDIPHGAGLAIIFPNWMNYVVDSGIAKFVQYATRVWQVDPTGKTDREVALEGIRRTRKFFTAIGAPTTLGFYRIDPADIPTMARKAVAFGPIGGFRELRQADVEQILQASL